MTDRSTPVLSNSWVVVSEDTITNNEGQLLVSAGTPPMSPSVSSSRSSSSEFQQIVGAQSGVMGIDQESLINLAEALVERHIDVDPFATGGAERSV